jgi:hypothetical protein
MTFFSEQGLTEAQVLQRVCNLLKERDPTFLIKTPLTIPNTNYTVFGRRFEAFFKICSGSIANMVILLEAAYREVNVRERSGETKLIGYKLIELIENQIALPDKLSAQLKDRKQVDSKDRRQYVVKATKLLKTLKSLPR